MRGRSPIILLILLVVGALIGTVIGELLGGIIPFLHISESIGFTPTTLDLSFMQITFGFTMKLNLASALGLFLAYLMYKRL